MDYLLDTHTLLWYINEDPKLSKAALEKIEDANNKISVSIASLWEIAVKVNIGKLNIHGGIGHIEKDLVQLGINLIPITPVVLDYYLSLPIHHRDPFDRLLISLALSEDMFLISADVQFDSYGVKRVW